MTDTRQALPPLPKTHERIDECGYPACRPAYTAEQMQAYARAALAAQPVAGAVAHPVAWLCSISHPDWLEVCERDAPGAFPVYATPQAAQAAPAPEQWPFEHGTDEAGTLNIKPSAPEPMTRGSDGWVTRDGGLSWHNPAPHAAQPLMPSPSISVQIGAPAPEPSAQPVAGVAAWMHEDGRVIPAATKASADLYGGAMRSSLAGYTIPLVRPSEPSAQQVVPLTWHLDADAAETLKQTIGDDDTVSEITLSVCDGHEGHGLYVWLTEYPEEGSLLLLGIAPKAAQEKT